MAGVVKLVVPVAKAVPPVALAYQSMVVPVPSEAINTTVPVPHLELSVPLGADGIAFIVAVTAVLVAEIHPVVVFLDSA